ncbi:MAG TPA: sigma-70 family RNA polymerase sigma factor [Jatrophihabitans sp.]|jgi:RNA polymerase sigma-70 factor (ECF subfamily)|uniref:RNA polymerase sigma factor n=1 Tax=Jatrophihabitans sp. TaxID=1932789 RepID=UPI002EE2A1A8
MTEVDLQALRQGDETAFLTVVKAYHGVLLRLARIYSPTREAAEEAVQETWIAVLNGLDGFEGRSALRTWICQIVVRIAQRRSAAERQTLPFSSLSEIEEDATPAVDADRFYSSGPYAGHWVNSPPDWSTLPEHALLSREVQDIVSTAIAELPQNQRIVITLRDVEGWSAAEVRELLDIEDGNQRILLHRARSRVRSALEGYLDLAC